MPQQFQGCHRPAVRQWRHQHARVGHDTVLVEAGHALGCGVGIISLRCPWSSTRKRSSPCISRSATRGCGDGFALAIAPSLAEDETLRPVVASSPSRSMKKYRGCRREVWNWPGAARQIAAPLVAVAQLGAVLLPQARSAAPTHDHRQDGPCHLDDRPDETRQWHARGKPDRHLRFPVEAAQRQHDGENSDRMRMVPRCASVA